MLIVYDSLTGNVERFVKKLGMRNIKINNGLIVDEPFVLITYTTGFGEVPKRVAEFLAQNHSYLVAVTSSGNRNWGEKFGLAADKISERYKVKKLSKFELSGNESEIENFLQEVHQLGKCTKMDSN
ncbi:class Ib ribonucleoside-diphosphate reductase assembly flavoprotein NrdI [Paenibacillus polymyxa]|uniref:class Ib ribonucleoside-diphosphate reductase assembly flavoprotein NrdI n=1 Tax=Paenibacillus polymyxa TaxID=1406 RepID=UPI002AB381D4|nr:class Ib ribonucleoside-diphosphate reductase assembly flavoprotein NrdI [Paenibacillus polymyxa]MDY8021104.1 class Ib ribonucleoside-diphosphate reductase assembly flavoprotein NrdI [Paenibacillus polymyxa]